MDPMLFRTSVTLLYRQIYVTEKKESHTGLKKVHDGSILIFG